MIFENTDKITVIKPYFFDITYVNKRGNQKGICVLDSYTSYKGDHRRILYNVSAEFCHQIVIMFVDLPQYSRR